MSNNYNHQKSLNDGQRQAERNQPLSPQKPNEPWAAYETRQKSYSDTKKGNS